MSYTIVNKRRYIIKRADVSFQPGKNIFEAKVWEKLRENPEVKLRLLKGELVVWEKPENEKQKPKTKTVKRMEKDMKPVIPATVKVKKSKDTKK